MGVYMTPLTERLFQLVEQAPRRYEWLFNEVAGLIPPGKAFRKREYHRMWTKARDRKRGVPKGYERPTDTENAIRFGRRAIFRSTIGTLARDGRVEIYEQDGEQWVRYGRDRMQLSQEQLRENRVKAAATYRASGKKRRISDEFRARQSERQSRYWQNASEEEKERRRAGWRAALARMTPEERQRRAMKAAETRKRREQKEKGDE